MKATMRVSAGAGRGIFLTPFPTANGISKLQCFAQLEPFRASVTSDLTPSGEEKR